MLYSHIHGTCYLEQMELKEAEALIQAGVEARVAHWADLGCGDGLFTSALSNLLLPGSHIHAVDQVHQSIQLANDLAAISFERADMASVRLRPGLDGILMANSIHYIADKASLLRDLTQYLAPDGLFLIVEYDTRLANAWVPYPIEFEELEQLGRSLGFVEVTKINERASRYSGTMYACLIRPFRAG